MATNTCLLYGATNWIGVNILIILISLFIVAGVFAISNIFATSMREKLKQAARSEITQAFISAIIIVALAVTATTACAATSSLSQSLNHQGTSDPFVYATYYIGNLSTNTGINLLTNLYSTSISYAIEAQVMQSFGGIFNTKLNSISGIISSTLGISRVVTLSIGSTVQLGELFTALSALYLTVFAPIVTIAIGLLFIQFVALPVLQYTAFSVILPVAIGMRSLAFLGTNLRSAANAVLAIAIAAYIIYPVMISFNAYVVSWIFSAQNPSYQYIKSTYVVPNIPVSTFFKDTPSTSYTGILGTAFTKIAPFVTSAFSSTGIVILPGTLVVQAQAIVNQTAQFLFASVVLILIDIAVTIGFASGLARALNGGLQDAGSFWSGI